MEVEATDTQAVHRNTDAYTVASGTRQQLHLGTVSAARRLFVGVLSTGLRATTGIYFQPILRILFLFDGEASGIAMELYEAEYEFVFSTTGPGCSDLP